MMADEKTVPAQGGITASLVPLLLKGNRVNKHTHN